VQEKTRNRDLADAMGRLQSLRTDIDTVEVELRGAEEVLRGGERERLDGLRGQREREQQRLKEAERERQRGEESRREELQSEMAAHEVS
jgi:hypothetical protein